jgi:3-oxoacyl-[acyl-carrier protein] reductase
MSFKDKIAMISGAGGGMGLKVAQDLLAAGAAVILLDQKPPPEGLDLSDLQVSYHQGDVTDEAFVAAAAAAALERHGRLDYLVNTVGALWFDRDTSCLEMDMDVWDRVMAINLKSFALTARHAAPAMIASGGGAMVHVASIDGLRGDNRPQDAYGASKAAVIRLSKSLAIQLAGKGLRSNCVLPGPVRSPMQDRFQENPELVEGLEAAIPLGRIGRTQDISDAILFLLSDKASFITGVDLVVDGGLTALPA